MNAVPGAGNWLLKCPPDLVSAALRQPARLAAQMVLSLAKFTQGSGLNQQAVPLDKSFSLLPIRQAKSGA